MQKRSWQLERSTLILILQQLRQQQRHLTPEQKQQQIRRIQVHNNLIICHEYIWVDEMKRSQPTVTMCYFKILI